MFASTKMPVSHQSTSKEKVSDLAARIQSLVGSPARSGASVSRKDVGLGAD